jgi:hypothetical protein
VRADRQGPRWAARPAGYVPSEADRDCPRREGFDHHVIKAVNRPQLLELLKTVADNKAGP